MSGKLPTVSNSSDLFWASSHSGKSRRKATKWKDSCAFDWHSLGEGFQIERRLQWPFQPHIRGKEAARDGEQKGDERRTEREKSPVEKEVRTREEWGNGGENERKCTKDAITHSLSLCQLFPERWLWLDQLDWRFEHVFDEDVNWRWGKKEKKFKMNWWTLSQNALAAAFFWHHWKWRTTSKRKMRACKKIHYSIQIQVTPTTCNLWQKRSKTWTDMRDKSSLLLFLSPWVSISLSLLLFSFDPSHLIMILFLTYSALGRERRESNRSWRNHSSPSQCIEGTHREFSRCWGDSDQDHVEGRRFEDASDSR